MKYKAVILDVDGTIIAPGVAGAINLSPRLIRSVRAVQERGIWISLATARSWDWVHDLAEALSLKSVLILDNGARIWDCQKKQYIWETYLPKQTAQRVLSFLRKFAHPVHLVDDDVRQTYDPEHPSALERVAKIMILHISPVEAHQLWETLQQFSDIQITKSISGEGVESIHITSKEATKEDALARAAEYMKVQLTECIGVGDSYNDIGLLMGCGLKVAMGNAVDEVKAIADTVIDAYSDDGVAKFLEKTFLSS